MFVEQLLTEQSHHKDNMSLFRHGLQIFINGEIVYLI